MQRKTNGPMEDAPPTGRSTRRDLVMRTLVVLGASVLVQPYGGISGLALAGSEPAKKKQCGVDGYCGPECGGDITCDNSKKGKVKCPPGKEKDPGTGRCVRRAAPLK
jgi:hypothetical protein